MKTLFVHRKGRFDKLRILLAKKLAIKKRIENSRNYNHPIASHLIQLNNELS
jgi:hypothetical protein